MRRRRAGSRAIGASSAADAWKSSGNRTIDWFVAIGLMLSVLLTVITGYEVSDIGAPDPQEPRTVDIEHRTGGLGLGA